MNISLKKVFEPIVEYYDKAMAVIMIALLLASIVLLSIRVVVARQDQARFAQQLDNLKPAFPAVAPIDRGPFDKGMREFEKPSLLEASELSKMFMVPEMRKSCAKCRKPIAYDATTCVFCSYEETLTTTQTNKDFDQDGMADTWEQKYGFKPNYFDDGGQDADTDGWSNVDEYKASVIDRDTNPRDKADFPPCWSFNKLVVNSTTSMQFNLTFMSAMKTASGYTFQINHLEGQTFWKKMNEEVLGFTIKKYEEKYQDDKAIPGRKIDVSELTLDSSERTVVLIKGRKMQQHEKSAQLTFVPDSASVPIAVSEGKEFVIRGKKYRVKGIDVGANKVVITDPSLNREVIIGPSGLIE